MRVITEPADCPVPPSGCVVTVGTYDGVHTGHRAVIDAVRAKAAQLGVASAVVTFDRHPLSVVRPEAAPMLLTTLDQRLELLEAAGLGYAVVLSFDEERARESARDFVERVLVGCLHARAVVVGEDFRFGHRRAGDVQLLREMGEDLGFEVVGLALVPARLAPSGPDEAQPVSSTRARALLAAGEVRQAGLLLGRPHEVQGRVCHGDGRGAELGYPTANVETGEGFAVPAVGIYAGRFTLGDGSRYDAAISLGVRPTFEHGAEPRVLLEAYLLDFAGDLYGERCRLSFVERLRDERRFPTVGELIDQMAVDVAAARDVLARPGAWLEGPPHAERSAVRARGHADRQTY